MQTLEAAALEYLKRGWSVIPINAQNKRPLVKWKDYQSRIAQPEEVARWWREYPDANIGIVTGRISHLAVVDIDVGKGADVEEITERFPTGTVVETGGGGRHLYFSITDQLVANQTSKGGIDVRGEGGYVVAPPSHHASGAVYRWLSRGKLPPFPEALLSPVNGNGSKPKSGEKWLTRILKGVGSGERNDAAARLAGYYFGKGHPFEVVLSMMEVWNTSNDPPLPHHELERTVRSVSDTAGRSKQATQQGEKPRFKVIGLAEYMLKHGDVEARWLVEGWVPDKTIGMLVAPPGSFKTWLLIDLAVSITTGMPFLGRFPVKRTGPVIIIQQEDFHGQMAERIGLVLHSRLPHVPDDTNNETFTMAVPATPPLYLHPDRLFRFNDKVVVSQLEEVVAHIRPAMVMLDPLYSAGSLDDYLASSAQDILDIKRIRDNYGCSFMFAHHTRKSNDKKKEGGQIREELWGSQILNAVMETGWQIRRKDEPNTASIRRHFKTSPDAAEGLISFHISTKMPYRFDISFREESEKERRDPDLLAILDERGPLTADELAKIVSTHRTTVLRRMQRLESAGVVRRDQYGRYVPVET